MAEEIQDNKEASSQAPAENVQPTKTEKPQEEVVSITRSQFDEIMGKLNMFEQIADKGRLAGFLAKQQRPNTMFVQLHTYETKDGAQVVVGWRMTKDRVWKEATGWKADQQVEILLENNEKVELSLADFYTLTSGRMKAEVIKRESDITGITYTLACEDGKERKISETFVN